jgi:hypothetical protein
MVIVLTGIGAKRIILRTQMKQKPRQKQSAALAHYYAILLHKFAILVH